MPVTREVMHSALGVTESYQVPGALMAAMLDGLAHAEETTAAGLSDVKQYLLLRMFC